MKSPVKIYRRSGCLRLFLFGFNVYLSTFPMKRSNNREKKQRRRERKDALRRELIERVHGCCPVCNCPLTLENVSIHHIVPRHVAPDKAKDPDNMVALCGPCHIGLHEEATYKANENLITLFR